MNKITYAIKRQLLLLIQMIIVVMIVAGPNLLGSIILLTLFGLITRSVYKNYGEEESNCNIISALIVGVIQRTFHI